MQCALCIVHCAFYLDVSLFCAVHLKTRRFDGSVVRRLERRIPIGDPEAWKPLITQSDYCIAHYCIADYYIGDCIGDCTALATTVLATTALVTSDSSDYCIRVLVTTVQSIGDNCVVYMW